MIERFIQRILAPLHRILDSFVGKMHRFSRPGRYTIIFFSIAGCICAVALFALVLLPIKYESKMTLNLPGSSIGAKVDLSGIGTASSSVVSPFSGSSLSPKVIYKSIATSSKVMARAAELTGQEKSQFPKPTIKLVDQTALIYLSVKGSSPEQAKKNTEAVYTALQEELQGLRLDEIARREDGIELMLEGFTDKLSDAKKRLIDFQSTSSIVTVEQFNQLPIMMEQLRQQQSQLGADIIKAQQEMQALSRIVDLQPGQASQALTLQADTYFQELLTENSAATSALASYRSKWGENHPKVKQEKLRHQSTIAAMKRRARQLVPDMNEEDFIMISLSEHPKRSELFYELIARQSALEGMQGKKQELLTLIQTQQQRMQADSETLFELAELEREHQLAEAIFTSAVSKIDTGKTDIYASYPLLQVFMDATLPYKRSGPQPWHIFIGAFIGCFFVALGLLVLWLQRKI